MIPTELILNGLTYAADAIYIANTIAFANELRTNRKADKYWVREKGDNGQDIGLKELQLSARRVRRYKEHHPGRL